MKKSTVSRLLSMTLALSMTLGSGSMAVFADSEDAAADVETVSVVEEDAENAVPDEDAAEETEVVTEAADTGAEVETVVQSENEESSPAEAAAEEIAVETLDKADDSAGTEIEVAAAEETEQADAALEEEAEFSGYVLMNIPYSDFYAAEGISGVDTVSSATVKTFNQNMAGGSYHSGKLNVTDPDKDDPLSGAEILGVTYPVKVNGDKSVLAGKTEVKDESKATITVASGKSKRTTKEVAGKDVLFASGDYAYYVLSEVPSNYKELTVNENGSFSFGAVQNPAKESSITSADLTYDGHYTPLTLRVAAEEITNDSVVTGIILKTADASYALRHVENIWRKTELGWNWTDLDGTGLSGKTITNVTYYLQDGGVYSYPVNVTVKQKAGEISAAFENATTVKISNLPEDIENPKVTVSSGRGATAVVIAESAEILEGAVTTDAAVYGTTYKITVTSDNYADIIAQTDFLIKGMSSVSIGGLTYFYADTKDDDAATVYQATVRSRAGSTVYNFTKADLTKVGVTDYYYGVATGVTPLSGTLYAYENGTGKATTYKEVYDGLGVETDASYDAISSATHYTGYHAKDIPSLVTYGTDAEGNKEITGLTLGRAVKTVDAVAYVEASILKAAGEKLTEEQAEVAATVLKVNPMDKPADSTITPVLFSAEYTSSRYGTGEFVIVPDEKVEGYVWSEYWNSVYAATISDGTTTAGAVHWIDMYGEAATSGHHYNRLEIALNNGESVGSNKSNVTRYAAFYDENGNVKDGTYTIKVYAEGYDVLEAKVEVTTAADQAAAANAEALIKAANGKFATAAEAQKAVNKAKAAFNDLTEAQKAILLASMSDAESQLAAAQTAATNQKTAEDRAAEKKNENKTDNKKQTVTKQSQSLKKLTPATKKLKASKLKKKKQTFKLKAKINGKGKVTFKKVSGNKKITISKAGKVTVKKGLKKGTYKVKVKVSIAATGNYKAASATKTIKIKVK